MSEISSTSELTTKEIVEQAIQDYHESILPYLNGMVPTIANKFSKSDLMSYDEKIIGCTPDGKPLYQKSLQIPSVSVGENTFIHNISNLDEVIDYNGKAICGYDNNRMCIPSIYPPNVSAWSICITKIDTTNIDLWVGSNFTDAYTLSDIEVTLKYTKTTDEAIAIGSDTDYSLEEKIVGTWVDGKKLYQKTIVLNNVSLIKDTWTTIFTDSSNSMNNVFVDTWKIGNRTGNSASFSIQFNDHALKIESGYSTSTWSGFVTIKYTKTTD